MMPDTATPGKASILEPPEMSRAKRKSRRENQKETIVLAVDPEILFWLTWGRRGASGTCTDSGPPLRMMTRGAASLISSCAAQHRCRLQRRGLDAGRHASSTTPASHASQPCGCSNCPRLSAVYSLTLP